MMFPAHLYSYQIHFRAFTILEAFILLTVNCRIIYVFK